MWCQMRAYMTQLSHKFMIKSVFKFSMGLSDCHSSKVLSFITKGEKYIEKGPLILISQ